MTSTITILIQSKADSLVRATEVSSAPFTLAQKDATVSVPSGMSAKLNFIVSQSMVRSVRERPFLTNPSESSLVEKEPAYLKSELDSRAEESSNSKTSREEHAS